MTYKVLITGSTGMIGKGVLLECLESDLIDRVTIINRSSVGITHPKLNEILLKDFEQIKTIKDKIGNPDACFHCMGVSAVGLSEEEYSRLTYNITVKLADAMYEINPSMVFIYVSGTGTDSSEKGRSMWARVKGRTENYVLKKGFGKAIMFRPGAIIPEKGIVSRTKLYRIIYILFTPLFPLMKRSKNVTTTTKIGIAMINTLKHENIGSHLENKEINQLAELN
jgi:uncharacterized protein YbjT (DUF2867 family)